MNYCNFIIPLLLLLIQYRTSLRWNPLKDEISARYFSLILVSSTRCIPSILVMYTRTKVVAFTVCSRLSSIPKSCWPFSTLVLQNHVVLATRLHGSSLIATHLQPLLYADSGNSSCLSLKHSLSFTTWAVDISGEVSNPFPYAASEYWSFPEVVIIATGVPIWFFPSDTKMSRNSTLYLFLPFDKWLSGGGKCPLYTMMLFQALANPVKRAELRSTET